MMASQRVELASRVHPLDDNLVAEAVARHGGYEEVDGRGLWPKIANAVGWAKNNAPRLKERYEDMLRYTAELEEKTEEDEALEQEHEVEDILQERTVDGKVEYLVKWKSDDAEDACTWEPRAHLGGAAELLEKWEKRHAGASEGVGSAIPGGGAGMSDPAAKRARLASEWKRVKQILPMSGLVSEHHFLVSTTSGGEVLVSNSRLRCEAPLLLVDFYESRLTFPTS